MNTLPPGKSVYCFTPKQVCIVCYCSRPKACYSIIVADLDSLCNKSYLARDDDEFIPVRTAIRLKVGKDLLLSFCGLGSTLYAFESAPHRKSAYAIDLSPYYSYSNNKPSTRTLVQLNKIRDMHHPKTDPFAIPTPDAKKILVFSRILSEDIDLFNIDFELYDPKTDTWQQLPGIHPHRLNSKKINSFTFIGTCTFFIETSFKQMFALNLKFVDQGWQRMNTFYGSHSASPRGEEGRFLVVEQHLRVSPIVAYDIHKQVRNPFGFSFPEPTLGDGIGYYKHLLFDLLPGDDEESGKYNFCTLVCGIQKSTNIPHLSLNVTSCDLSRYKRNKDGSYQDYDELDRCMTVCDPIKFCLDVVHFPFDFQPLCFFSIHPQPA